MEAGGGLQAARVEKAGEGGRERGGESEEVTGSWAEGGGVKEKGREGMGSGGRGSPVCF